MHLGSSMDGDNDDELVVVAVAMPEDGGTGQRHNNGSEVADDYDTKDSKRMPFLLLSWVGPQDSNNASPRWYVPTISHHHSPPHQQLAFHV